MNGVSKDWGRFERKREGKRGDKRKGMKGQGKKGSEGVREMTGDDRSKGD